MTHHIYYSVYETVTKKKKKEKEKKKPLGGKENARCNDVSKQYVCIVGQ